MTRQLPELGLVCLSTDEQCRYRSITRARYLGLPENVRDRELRGVYWDNIQRLHAALGYCARRDIKLYRMSSAIFPMSDMPAGDALLKSMRLALSSIGRRAERLGIRVVVHPDQFVVLNSESQTTRDVSRIILDKHALAFDLMGLPQSAWSCMNIHGGKAGRGDLLVETIAQLPPSVRNRLTLENDEYSFGAEEILDICHRAGVPMVFDCHHHVIKEGLDSYNHPSLARMTRLAAATWPDPAWQMVHVSNGETAFLDRYHAQMITMIPRAFAKVPFIEVEARGKELAIAGLRQAWPKTAIAPDGFPLRKITAKQKRDAVKAADAE